MKMLLRAVLFLCIWSSVLCFEVPEKRRYFSNYQQQQQGSQQQGSQQQGSQQQGSLTTDPGSNYDNSLASSSSPHQVPEGGHECDVGSVYKDTIPAGMNKEDYLQEVEGENIYKICVEKCCRLGPNQCQYIWIMGGKCFTVGCTELNAANCKPKKVSFIQDSIYISMVHQKHTEQFVELDQLPTTTHTPTQTTPLRHIVAPPTTSNSAHLNTDYPEIVISFSGDMDITLPQNSTHIFSSTWPVPKRHEKYLYHWKKILGPSDGTLSGQDKEDVVITGLVPGVYVLKLTVKHLLGEESGEGVVNITVRSPVRVNSPPISVISPSKHVTVTLPHSSILFDASGSHDDLDFDTLTFQWEEVEGPVDSTLTSNSPILQITDLKEGNYKYKLTVTDQDGVRATDFVTVAVKPELSYPPVASAGKDQVMKLPNNQVTLDGSESTAFKGDLKYSWVKVSGPGPLDMRGTHTPLLHLYHISSTGDYIFRLTVTDTQGHTSSVDVSLVVLPEHNLPPVAEAGPNRTVNFPNTEVVLNGSASYDDYKIDSWLWTQISGPSDIKMSGVTSPVLKVEDLHIDEDVGSPTVYIYQLCIWDYHNLTDMSNVTITYRKDPKIPPRVSTGPHLNITLPQDIVILNGSASHDDFGISSYQWMRSESSPAAGLVAYDSDRTPVLILSDLVVGTYNFTLTVSSRDMISASDSVSVTVLPNPMEDYILLVHLEGDVSNFTKADQRQLERVLSLIMDDVNMDYDISIVTVRPHGPYTEVEFYATRQDDHTSINANMAYSKLTDKGQDYYYPNSKFHFVKIKMKVCQLPCSGHGSCDKTTHKCNCMKFWMENPIKAHFGKKETNCEWSLFYVILAVVVSMVVFLVIMWLTCYCSLKKRRLSHSKRRIHYAILDHKDNESSDGLGYQRTSLMVSESEAEEEILYESSSKKSRESSNSSIHTMTDFKSKQRNGLPNGKMDHPAGGKVEMLT